jgi:cysteine desulfurase
MALMASPSPRYFDNAATTPLDPRVLADMVPFLTEEFGNAHSIHGFGTRAMAAVDLARARVASLLGAESPDQILFTSGATEANNWVIDAFDRGAISPFEHSAVREPARRKGFEVLSNEGEFIVAPAGRWPVISIMGVNNETGTMWDAHPLRCHAGALHSDMTQAFGKTEQTVEHLDFATFSAHKFYGPKGVGALYFAEAPPEPFILGGEQEHGYRGGTLNVPGIVGMGAAAAIARDELLENRLEAEVLRQIVLDGLRPLADWQVNGGERVSPYILSVSFQKIIGESLVVEADSRGFAISAGAACSSRSAEPSHVLRALGLEDGWLSGTVRISFGRFNSREAAQALAEMLLTGVEKLRTLS